MVKKINQILALALPLILQQLCLQLQVWIDRAMLGHVNTEFFSAIGNTSVPYYMVTSMITAICGALLFVIFATDFIGVCASAEMRCQATKIWGIGAAAVVFGTSLINLISGKEGQVPG